MRVLVFSIGFGPELFGFNDRHGTRWKISAIPLGGYVKFFGDENAASVPDQETIGQMTEAEQRESFFFKPVGAARRDRRGRTDRELHPRDRDLRGAGVPFYGKQVTVAAHRCGRSRAARRPPAGFKPGDLIVSIDGKTVESFADVQRIAAFNPGRALIFVIDRGGQRVTVTATPERARSATGSATCSASVSLDISGPIMPARIAGIVPRSAADAAGFQPDDRVRKIDGKPVNTFLDLREVVAANPERELEFEVERGGRTIVLRATPGVHSEKDASGTCAASACSASPAAMIRRQRSVNTACSTRCRAASTRPGS